MVGAFMKYYGLSEEQALFALEKYREIFAKEGIYRLSVYPGVKTMLQKLKKEKTIVLATSKPILYAKEIMERTGLSCYFDYLEGATMDESRTEKSDVIRYAIEKYNLDKKDIIMVGDRENDIKGALENGVEALGVLYGYGSREELINAGCKHFAKTILEAEKFLI